MYSRQSLHVKASGGFIRYNRQRPVMYPVQISPSPMPRDDDDDSMFIEIES